MLILILRDNIFIIWKVFKDFIVFFLDKYKVNKSQYIFVQQIY